MLGVSVYVDIKAVKQHGHYWRANPHSRPCCEHLCVDVTAGWWGYPRKRDYCHHCKWGHGKRPVHDWDGMLYAYGYDADTSIELARQARNWRSLPKGV